LLHSPAASRKTSVEVYGIDAQLLPLRAQHPIGCHASARGTVARVNELMALCDRLEAQLTTAQTQSRRLLESTLHEALAT